MITYKGDPFVRGKHYSFKNDELNSQYPNGVKFIKNTSDGYIVEYENKKIPLAEETRQYLVEENYIDVIGDNK